MHACKTTEASRRTKQLEKENKAKERIAQRQYEDAVNAHNNRQTLKTKERMQETKLRSEYYNRKKQKSFWERLFGKKKKHKKPKKNK